jgi:hypothetical protein
MGFTLQGAGSFLHWLTLVIMVILPVLIAFAAYKLGGLPGSIARSRQHPQAEAISVCGWLGIVTIVLWPIAMIWAHLAPGSTISGAGSTKLNDHEAVLAKIQKASRQLAHIETRLNNSADEGA